MKNEAMIKIKLLQDCFNRAKEFNRETGAGRPSPLTYLRMERLLRLEMLLYEHRKAHAEKWAEIQGKKALHHMLLMKYQWSVEKIESLSLAQSLSYLNDEMAAVDLSEFEHSLRPPVLDEAYNMQWSRTVLEPWSDDEWEPLLYKRYPLHESD